MVHYSHTSKLGQFLLACFFFTLIVTFDPCKLTAVASGSISWLKVHCHLVPSRIQMYILERRKECSFESMTLRFGKGRERVSDVRLLPKPLLKHYGTGYYST